MLYLTQKNTYYPIKQILEQVVTPAYLALSGIIVEGGDVAEGFAACAGEPGGEGLLCEHVEMLVEFRDEFGVVAAHLEGEVYAEGSYGVRLAFGVDFLEAPVEKISADGVRLEALLTKHMQQNPFHGRVGGREKKVDYPGL